jgi:pimeloyl-ACP methyl ester carboxylesterase
MNIRKDWLAVLVFISATILPSAVSGAALQDAPGKELPLPGHVFLVDGHTAFLIPARVNSAATSRPWVWYAPTLPGLPGREEQWMFDQFLDAGIAIAGVDVGESYGSPAGRALFTTFHAEMTTVRGYSAKPVLLGRSRGGLMTLSWAVENPDKVAGFAGIYPVCNVESYPGVAKAAGAYQLKPEELQAHLKDHNPVDRLAPLARAGVPLFAIHGDVDSVVPLEANSGLVKERYAKLGGSMELIVPPGQGHNMWPGFFQSDALVNFVKACAGPTITLLSPQDHQVIQRRSKKQGSLIIKGELAGHALKSWTVEARLIVDHQPGKWRRLSLNPTRSGFQAQWNAPAGGWHRLEVRALSGTKVLAESAIEQVGIGEVFVIAGQSNCANHGAEKQNTRTGLVAAFDGRRWRPAQDPQPGASGSGGSFIPPFGDAMAERFHVPIGIVACGVGATSVREWLPKGARFPNPPTLTAHVQQLADGGWESKGTIFGAFSARMKPLGPRGFRAVLWHQGESDAHQADPTRTLPGNLYRDYLEQLIRDSRREIGWSAPWFVAQASYHVPGDEASPDIRAAQASLWKDGIAIEGPDTDALKGDLRDNGGQGVHFSGPGLREHAARWTEKVAPWLEKQ